ncbi:MAG: hypothetical protein GY696_04215 [Gammaproteobacteria bacterium]|nr:hypothetical protein [Gammaproteobacteria bacterium]
MDTHDSPKDCFDIWTNNLEETPSTHPYLKEAARQFTATLAFRSVTPHSTPEDTPTPAIDILEEAKMDISAQQPTDIQDQMAIALSSRRKNCFENGDLDLPRKGAGLSGNSASSDISGSTDIKGTSTSFDTQRMDITQSSLGAMTTHTKSPCDFLHSEPPIDIPRTLDTPSLSPMEDPVFTGMCAGRTVTIAVDMASTLNAISGEFCDMLRDEKTLILDISTQNGQWITIQGAVTTRMSEFRSDIQFAGRKLRGVRLSVIYGLKSTIIIGSPGVRKYYLWLPPSVRNILSREKRALTKGLRVVSLNTGPAKRPIRSRVTGHSTNQLSDQSVHVLSISRGVDHHVQETSSPDSTSTRDGSDALFPSIYMQEKHRLIYIQNCARPTNRLELQQFFNALRRYRRYVDWYGRISKNLRILLNEGEVFNWMPLHECEFADIKKLALQQPIPTRPLELLSWHASQSLSDDSDHDMPSPDTLDLGQKALRPVLRHMLRNVGVFDPQHDICTRQQTSVHEWCARFRLHANNSRLSRWQKWAMMQLLVFAPAQREVTTCKNLCFDIKQTLRTLINRYSVSRIPTRNQHHAKIVDLLGPDSALAAYCSKKRRDRLERSFFQRHFCCGRYIKINNKMHPRNTTVMSFRPAVLKIEGMQLDNTCVVYALPTYKRFVLDLSTCHLSEKTSFPSADTFRGKRIRAEDSGIAPLAKKLRTNR